MNSGKAGAATGPYTFLRDEVAAADAFGSHQRIAEAIAASIIQNPTLRVVGLLGPWGSGKSTVIGFLGKELNKSIETHVFTYDAWLHQADPPRRSFLESFINFLVQNKLTEKGKWTERVDQLNGRIQDTEVTKTPQLTIAGRVILTTLLAVPLGSGLVLKAAVGSALRPEVSLFWQFVAGVALLALPLITAIGVYLWWRPTWKILEKRFWAGANWTHHRGDRSREAIFSLFLSRQTQTTKDRITKDPEPTSIEFQRTFRELMASVVDLRHRFLVVIDNLDRLPEMEAIVLWSTIRSFFLGSELSGHKIDEKLLPTVILPVDERAIERIYNEDDARNRASAFFEKTFDITFKVNRPVFTGWRTYLERQMKELFGNDLGGDWVRLTSRILDRAQVDSPNDPITPRRINSLVNRLGVQWMLRHDDDISFAAVAYYSIFQSDMDSGIVQAVMKPKMPIEVYDPNWQRSVAAIHFGVSPTVANEVLLDTPIRSAIDADSQATFFQLAATAGFADQMVRICERMNEEHADPVRLLRTASLLGKTKFDSSASLTEAWRQLRAALPRTSPWTQFTRAEQASVQCLLDQADPHQSAEILKTVGERAFALAEAVLPAVARHMANLWRYAEKEKPETLDHVDSIHIGGSAQSYLMFVAECVDNPDILSKVTTTTSDEEISAALTGDLANTEASAEDRLRGVVRAGPDIEVASYVESVLKLLVTQSGASTTKAMLAVGLMRDFDSVKAGLKSLLDNASLQSALLEGIRTQDVDRVARALVLILARRPESVPNPPQSWTQTVTQLPDLPDRIEAAIGELTDPADISFDMLATTGARDANLQPLIRTLLSRWLDRGDPTNVSPETLFAGIGKFGASLSGPDQERLLREVAVADFWTLLAQQPFATVAWALIQSLVALGGDFRTAALEALRGHLLGATETDWARAMVGPTEWSEAAKYYAEHVGNPKLSLLLEPLKQNLGEMLETGTPASWPHWFALAAHLSISAKGVLMRSARDRLLYSKPSTALALLEAGGSDFLSDGDFEGKAEEVCRELVPLLLDESGGLAYLATHSQVYATYVNAAKTDTQDVLFEVLRKRLESSDDISRPVIGELLALWSAVASSS